MSQRTVSLSLEGVEPTIRALRAMPEAMQKRILVPVVQKAAKLVERSIATLIPVNRGKRRRAKDHYRNVMTSVVRSYPADGNVIAVIGPESKMAPHAHLVEEGTAVRQTNSKPVYKKVAVGVKVKLKNGKPVRKAIYARVAAGSKMRKQNKPQRNRGRMPAYHPVARGSANASSAVQTLLVSGIRNGITQELTAAKLARGHE